MATCAGSTKGGEPCRVPALRGGSLCFTHAPSAARARAKARRKGGLRAHGLDPTAPAPTVRLAAVRDVVALLEVAAGDALGMQPSAVRARTLCNVVAVAIRALEVGALEERVAALEARSPWKDPTL